MSLPTFPTGPALSREEAINQIISSIAMEELGLSHIINAEGEKLQYVLGTIPGVSGPSATIEDVLKVNESVRAVLQNAAESQSLLRSKLQTVLSSAVLTGPTGATGKTGATGEPGRGAILPFSTGILAVELPAGADGNPEFPVLAGVGTSSSEAVFDGENVNLEGAPELAANFAFVVPREGVLSDFTAYFYTEATHDLNGATGTVTAQLYKSESPENYLFTRIAGVTLEPQITDATPAGAVLTGNADIPEESIPLSSGSRLLLAFKAHSEGAAEEITLKGFGSASVAIS